MSSIIDNMRDHWNSLDSNNSLEIPQWGTFYKQPMNLKQQGKLLKYMKDDPVEGLAYVLIHLALNEKGENIFTLEHKQFLLTKVDPERLSEVANWLMQTPTKKDIKKK